MGLHAVLRYAHLLVQDHVRPGDCVIDATAGGGNDTLHLARCVGPAGTVYALDIQPEALAKTKARLDANGFSPESPAVHLIQGSHHLMRAFIPESRHGQVAAVMFNLGYFPGGDESRITTEETTLPALEAALDLLRPDGLLTVVVYPGHPGGDAEERAVAAWAEALDHRRYRVLVYKFVNRAGNPPYLIAINKIRMKE